MSDGGSLTERFEDFKEAVHRELDDFKQSVREELGTREEIRWKTAIVTIAAVSVVVSAVGAVLVLVLSGGS